MAMNSVTSLAAEIHQARLRLAASEQRATRLAERIGRIGGESVQARALADTLAILNDFISFQKSAIASLEACHRDALGQHLETELEEALNAEGLAVPESRDQRPLEAPAKIVQAAAHAQKRRKAKNVDRAVRSVA